MTRFHATDKGNIPFTAAEELERDREEAQFLIDRDKADKAQAVAEIKAEMDAADLKIIRAMIDGDTAKIRAHKIAQAKRRAKLNRA